MNENHVIYICLYCFFSICALLDIWPIKIQYRQKIILLTCSAGILCLFAGCRWFDVSVGNEIFDYAAYEYAFTHPLDLKDFSYSYQNADNYIRGMDPGYLFISSIFARYLCANANVFFLLVSILTVYFLVKGFQNNQLNRYIFLLLYIYVTRLYIQYNFIMMRQALAMSIVWWAFAYISKNQNRKFILSCLIAAAIHMSAVIALLALFLNKVKFSLKCCIVLIGISICAAIALPNLLEVVLTHMGAIAPLIMAKYLSYIQEASSGGNILNYVECLPFLVIAFKYKNEITADQKGNLFFNMFIFYMFIIGFALVSSVAMRITSYFIYPFFFLTSWLNQHKRTTLLTKGLNYVWLCYFMIYGIRLFGNYHTTSDYAYKIFFLHN